MKKVTRAWMLFIALAAGAIVGSIIGEVLSGVAPVLARGFTVGINPPFVADLNVVTFTLGFTLHLNLAGGIMVLLLVLLLGR
ncbi:MAG: DUF4321 domain-containing protein [Bacillota bacterium]|jgi:hypothetical protein